MKTAFQPGRLCAVLLSAGLSSGFFTPRAHALTLQEAYALKGSGKVAAELLLSASGAPGARSWCPPWLSQARPINCWFNSMRYGASVSTMPQ
jgi:hypothetical protein